VEKFLEESGEHAGTWQAEPGGHTVLTGSARFSGTFNDVLSFWQEASPHFADRDDPPAGVMEWLEEAAKSSAAAQYALGCHYETGEYHGSGVYTQCVD
jgi:hypothetical protein